MNRDRVQNTVEFYYNGERIDGTLFTYFHDDIEKSQTFMFNFKGNNVHIALEEDKQYYNVAPFHCKIIDKLGNKTYQKYCDYQSLIHDIKRKYIIVDDEVYNFYCALLVKSPKVFNVSIRLDNETIIDGTNKETTIKERGNKRALIDNLKSQVNYYFKEKNIKPKSEQLNVEKTQKYQEAKQFIKQIQGSL